MPSVIWLPMSRLDLKLPPDLVALLVAGLMWWVSTLAPMLDWPAAYRIPATLALFVAGATLIVMARIDFARAGTSFSPVAPERSRHLVTTGVYRLSRNPMYLGTLLVLLAFAAWRASPSAAIASLAFVAYTNRYQIRPEEQVLLHRFGSAYEAYRRKVRRWI